MGFAGRGGEPSYRGRPDSQIRRKLAGTVEELDALLDRTARTLEREPREVQRISATLDELVATLQTHKILGTEAEWREVVARCRQHPVTKLLHEDPFTERAFAKPRGYPGDAELMDFIYDVEDGRPPPPASPLGRVLFDHHIRAPASLGVRSRRAAVASHIDRIAEERPRPHVLSIAAGHLREASLSVAIRRRRTGRVVALDSDARSLEEVRASYGGLGVETQLASFRYLLAKDRYCEEFDFVYSTGLFDYLSLRSGRRLVAAMHRMLRPGGSLLVANFLPGVRDVGLMEAFMDWNLVYRSRHDMIDLTHDLPEGAIKNVTLWSEEALNIIFLRVTRQ